MICGMKKLWNVNLVNNSNLNPAHVVRRLIKNCILQQNNPYKLRMNYYFMVEIEKILKLCKEARTKLF